MEILSSDKMKEELEVVCLGMVLGVPEAGG